MISKHLNVSLCSMYLFVAGNRTFKFPIPFSRLESRLGMAGYDYDGDWWGSGPSLQEPPMSRLWSPLCWIHSFHPHVTPPPAPNTHLYLIVHLLYFHMPVFYCIFCYSLWFFMFDQASGPAWKDPKKNWEPSTWLTSPWTHILLKTGIFLVSF